MAIKYLTDLDLTGNKIINLGAPTGANDVANKAYVDGLVNGISWKDSVRAATTGNITLSAPQTIDGIAVIAGDRVLVKDQTLGENNGIYIVAAGAWTRSTDMDSAAEVEAAATFVEEGTANGGRMYTQTAVNVTLGTTPLTFVLFSSSTSLTARDGLVLTGNTLDVETDDTTLTINGGVGSGGVVKVKPAGISATELATDAVTTQKILNGAVTTAKLDQTASSEAVSTATIRDNAVTTAKINAQAVTTAKLDQTASSEAVTTATIRDSAVTTPKIANSAVDSDKLAASVAGAGLTGGGGSALAVGAGTGITVNANDVQIATGYQARKTAASVGNGAATTFNIVHNYGTQDVSVTVYEVSTGAVVFTDVVLNTNSVDVTFNTAPTTNQYRVVIMTVL